MTIAPVSPRNFRIELDHLSLVKGAISSVTVDLPLSIFEYTFPFFAALLTEHQELRLNDQLQARLIDEQAKITVITQVESLKEIAGLMRDVTVYLSSDYYSSSYGGCGSLTTPIIFIPRSHMIEAQTGSDNPETDGAGHLATFEDSNANEASQIPATFKPINLANWNFTADESLFFIAREIANIASNNPLHRIISKVFYVVAIFFIAVLPFPIALKPVLLAIAVSLYFAAEKTTRNHLDVKAVKFLMTYFENRGENPGRAIAAGKFAIQKLIEQNKERHSENELCQLYITPEGDNLLGLTNPSLTARFYRLNKHNFQTTGKIFNS